MTYDKVRENRLRRMIERRGFVLAKCRRRDPRALGYGHFMIIDPRINGVVAGHEPFPYSFTLDDVDKWLRR